MFSYFIFNILWLIYKKHRKQTPKKKQSLKSAIFFWHNAKLLVFFCISFCFFSFCTFYICSIFYHIPKLEKIWEHFVNQYFYSTLLPISPGLFTKPVLEDCTFVKYAKNILILEKSYFLKMVSFSEHSFNCLYIKNKKKIYIYSTQRLNMSYCMKSKVLFKVKTLVHSIEKL